MATRAEKKAEQQQEIKELTRIAKVILIDSFASCEDGSSCSGYGYDDAGVWTYMGGTKRYIKSCIRIVASSSRDPLKHIRVGHFYEMLNNSGNVVNCVNPPRGYNGEYNKSNVLKKKHQIYLEKFLVKKNYNTRNLLKNDIALKMSHRPTEEEVAWATTVLDNEGIKSDSGRHVIELNYVASVRQIFDLGGTNGVEEGKRIALDRLKAQLPTQSVSVKVIPNHDTVIVSNTTFHEEVISYYGNSCYLSDLTAATEI